MFENSTIGVVLLISHILASLTVGFIFRFWKINNHNNIFQQKNIHNSQSIQQSENVNFSDLGNILSKSILNSIKTILLIGGFVILFSVILSILNESKILTILSNILLPFFYLFKISEIAFPTGFISGIFEVTNGLNIISNIPFKQISCNIILSSFLLGFGGLSVLLQVYSIISKSNISIKPYIIGKLSHAIIASIYTYIFLYIIPFFNFDL